MLNLSALKRNKFPPLGSFITSEEKPRLNLNLTALTTPKTTKISDPISMAIEGIATAISKKPLARMIKALQEDKPLKDIAKALLPIKGEAFGETLAADPEKMVETVFNVMPIGMANKARDAAKIAKEVYEAQQILEKAKGLKKKLPDRKSVV